MNVGKGALEFEAIARMESMVGMVFINYIDGNILWPVKMSIFILKMSRY